MFYKILYAIVRAALFVVYPVKFYGRDNIEKGAALVCGNHTDNLDAVFLAFALGIGENPAFLGKKELFKGKFMAAVLKNAGVISIDRGSADIGAVKKCFSALKNQEKLVIFPEGTRSRDGQMSDAKAGAGMFALRTGVPVIPMYIAPNKRLFRANIVIIGKPYIPSEAGKRGNEAYLSAAEEIMSKISELKENSGQIKKLHE